MRFYRYVFFALSGLLATFMLASGQLAAVTPDSGVVRSYLSDPSVRQGMIVALAASEASKIEPLTYQTAASMLGVVVSPTQAPIAVTGDAGNQMYVATSGQYNVLVSTENGTIKAGDYISISSLKGIGMKANDVSPTILGRAAESLSGSSIVQSGVSIKTSSGQETVAIGSVPVTISISPNPNLGRGIGNLPGFLQIVSRDVAAKPVDAPRVYIALFVLIVVTLIAGVVLYSGIRSGIVSIGRNPLARHSIFAAIVQAVITGILVFVIGLFAVYLLLRL